MFADNKNNCFFGTKEEKDALEELLKEDLGNLVSVGELSQEEADNWLEFGRQDSMVAF